MNILDRSYRIACKPEEEAGLLQAVDYLDGKMRELRDSGKALGNERIAVLAALNITHELLTLRLGNGFDIGAFKRKMNSMVRSIDQAIGRQDELF
ncbi:MAG TPA: cell division protein ZapA [Burkholderiales bacterium]|nr:cell division protein ZapA [Burkholderiales bacterium]